MMIRNGVNLNPYADPYAIRDDKNVNIEISYDNFDAINLDLEKKRRYAQDLLGQIEENKRKRQEALERKRLEDLEEELRLKRERELIEKRQNEENKRYRPQIDLPIQKLPEPVKKERKKIPSAKVVTNEVKIIDRNSLNENTLRYLNSRKLQIDSFNDRILEQLRLLNNDFVYNINTLKDEIGILNDMNEKNKKYKDRLCREVHFIKQNLDNKKLQDTLDSRSIYELITPTGLSKSIVANMNSYKSIPGRRWEIRSYVTKEEPGNERFFVDYDKKGDGLRLSPYVNLSHVISYDTPRWRANGDGDLYD